MLLLAAVYCAFLFIASLPTGADPLAWVRTAPAWQGYGGELDTRGRLVYRFGPYEAGKLTVRYDLTTGRVTVRGSLQSFHYGHNAGPFPYHEALAACQAVADALQLPPDAIRVSILETGITVPTGEAPSAFLAQLAQSNYGPTQRPVYAKEPPANCAHPLQYTATFEQYKIKLYDKGSFNRLMRKPLPPTGNGLRFEIAYRKAKRLGAVLGWKGTLSLANLMQADVYRALSNQLLKSWQDIHLAPTMDLHGLSIDERALLVAGSNPDFWRYAKQEIPTATYKRKRALFHKLQKQQQQKPAAEQTPYTAELEKELAAARPPGEPI